MGLFSANVSLRVRLEHESLHPGQFVTGTVTLSADKAIDAQELSVIFKGNEHLKWEESGNDSANNYYHRDHELFTTKVNLLASQARVAEMTILAGEYTYPFEFQLPPDLLPSFHYYNAHADWTEVTRDYKVIARLCQRGKAKPIEESATLKLLPAEETTTKIIQAKAVSDTKTKAVQFLGCFNRGPCHVKVELKQDAYDITESNIQVHFVINNKSSRRLKALNVVLYEDVLVDREHNGDPPRSGMRIISKRSMDPAAVRGVTNGTPLSLTLPIIPTKDPRPEPPLGNMSTYFLKSVSYRVAVECAMGMCPRVSVSVPVRLFRGCRIEHAAESHDNGVRPAE